MAKKETGKKAAAIAVAAMSVLGVVLGGAALIKQVNSDKTREISSTFGYEVGLLDEETGRDKSGGTAWRTKDFVSVNELAVDVDEDDGSISYTLYYYDEDKAFLSKGTTLTLDYKGATDTEMPSDAEYVRIVFTHTNDTDISSSDIRNYTDLYKVSYSK